MHKTRNPRYAPEYLERKLCPTGLIVPAQVSGIESPPTYPPIAPYPTGTPNPPLVPPTEPAGPAEPTAIPIAVHA